VPGSVKLSKSDARRALVRYHFAPCESTREAFDRLRSVQFDPIAPIGCNHDLVLQARVPDYRVGDWERIAYEDRLVYDGWDKQASLVPFEGWPLRRVFYKWHRDGFKHIFDDHADAVEAILADIGRRGPLLPKECEFQARKAEWKGSWHGPSVAKQTLRALWHAGCVMTAGRRKGQHLYDLTERVVPEHLYNQPELKEEDAIRELVLERHRAMGLLRPNAAPEIWSYRINAAARKAAIDSLQRSGELVPVEVEGVKAHATPRFLEELDSSPIEPRVTFVAPLDQLMWDRKMVSHLFDFDYVWEIYTPVANRRWGYYVLPVLFGDRLVARAEFWSRSGTLELRGWHFEAEAPQAGFYPALEQALLRLMRYASAEQIIASDGSSDQVRSLVAGLSAA